MCEIVPEIDMPGHATAAIAAYPELGAVAASRSLSRPAGACITHLFNLEPATFQFLENVLDEVLELFPSRYIHIGGDEAVKDEWNASAAVQARRRDARASAIRDACKRYFTQHISRYLAAHGRAPVGWDEILPAGLPRDAMVMSWHGVSGAHAAALAGNDAVLSPDPDLYFDHRQSTLADEPPGRIASISAGERVSTSSRWTPASRRAQQRHILGVAGEFWTEHIATERRVEWMALPRAAAVAEVGWSSQRRLARISSRASLPCSRVTAAWD